MESGISSISITFTVYFALVMRLSC